MSASPSVRAWVGGEGRQRQSLCEPQRLRGMRPSSYLAIQRRPEGQARSGAREAMEVPVFTKLSRILRLKI